jgi:hypothetical protein
MSPVIDVLQMLKNKKRMKQIPDQNKISIECSQSATSRYGGEIVNISSNNTKTNKYFHSLLQ